MRALIALVTLFVLLSAVGCGNSSSGNTYDVVSEPGITQPPPPDANTIAGNNRRDPRNRKPRPDADPAGTPEATEPQPAPENSESSVIMNADGSITEFRVFKDHPQIIKAEANWLDPNAKKLTVHLKSGKKLEVTTDKIPYLHKASSDLILVSAGVKAGGVKGERPRIVSNR